MSDTGRESAAQKMRDAGAHEEAVRAFESAYRRLESGHEAMFPSSELEAGRRCALALKDLPDVDAADALADVAMIKLNGGLATTMGLQEPKSLVQARDGRSFLEIIVGQTLALRRRYGVRLPLYAVIYAMHCLLVVVQDTAAGNDEVTWPAEPIQDSLGGALHLARRRLDLVGALRVLARA